PSSITMPKHGTGRSSVMGSTVRSSSARRERSQRMATRDTTRLLDGLAFVESPRWHDDRLWFSHWGAGEIIAVDLDGTSEVVGRAPAGFGGATEWRPAGRMLLPGPELLREEPDGPGVRHADLGPIA